MRHTVIALNIPAVNATGGIPADIRDLREATVYVHGAGTYSLKVQVKISGKLAATVVPAGNPGTVAPPTTSKPATDVPGSGPDFNDDWVDLSTAITANAIVPIADQVTGAPLAVTHVRIFRTTLTDMPKANVGGRDARSK